jgi:hypothetical protein
MESVKELQELIKFCVLLDWFYVDDEMFLVWYYTNKGLEKAQTLEDFLEFLEKPKDTVWLLKCYGRPKLSVFKELKKKFKTEGIKEVKWFNNFREVKTWERAL